MHVATKAARNIRLYPWFVVGFDVFAWLPIFILYFNDFMSLTMVLRLEALYYAAVVLLEVPSGYFSDRVGRRPTLVISVLALASAYILFLTGNGFTVFAGAQFLLAVAISFRSGTDTSFHYDSLVDLGREGEYGRREAVVTRFSLMAGAAGALLGGVLGLFSLKLAYALSLAGAIGAFFIALRFREPEAARVKPPPFLGQLGRCFTRLKNPHLAWLFGFSVLMVVVVHVPYEFYQIYLELLGKPDFLSGGGTPLAAGFIMAVSTLFGAWAAGYGIRMRDWAGIHGILIAALFFYVGMIAVMGLLLHPIVIPLIMLRSTPHALVAAPLKAAISPRVESSMRATYFSLQSLTGRLAFSLTLASLSLFFTEPGATDWSTLSGMLLGCALLGAGGLLLLGWTARASMRAQRRS